MGNIDVLTKPETEVAIPPLYDVVLLNDDFTPMDFVVHVLRDIFGKNDVEAVEIMLAIHHEGAGVAGTYTQEMAEQKQYETMTVARKYDHPLIAEIRES